MRIKELLRAAEQGLTSAEVEGRRRPGRAVQVSPHLIPLLQDPATVDIPVPLPATADSPSLDEDFAFVKGIGFALVLSVPLWAIIGAGTWVVLR